MEVATKNRSSIKEWEKVIENEIGEIMRENSRQHDQDDTFVEDNYKLLIERGILQALIPQKLGGGGLQHNEICTLLKSIAHYCPSTALALSMHQHLIAANVWKFHQGKGGESVLRKVVENKLVLISTGARDWLESNGEMEKVEGGFRLNAIKHFASQSAFGDVLVTSAPYHHPEKGWLVLHFSVPVDQEAVKVHDNWYAMGMRGTGSNSVEIKNAFIPEEVVVLQRPRGEFHPFWNVVLTVALPLIMSVYTGIAERAYNIALQSLPVKKNDNAILKTSLGELFNQKEHCGILWRDMVRLTNNFEFAPEDRLGNDMLSRKTLLASACKKTVEMAMELAGGQSYFRNRGLEKLFRDVQAGHFHPLPDRQQYLFTGDFILNQKKDRKRQT